MIESASLMLMSALAHQRAEQRLERHREFDTALLKTAEQAVVLLDAQSARRAPEDRRFTVNVTYRDGADRGVERVYTHNLDAYVGLPSLVATRVPDA